tara:strand:+ start:54 stop:488 length:435 start_codon:yes stop_codon:yes gene_type:complete
MRTQSARRRGSLPEAFTPAKIAFLQAAGQFESKTETAFVNPEGELVDATDFLLDTHQPSLEHQIYERELVEKILSCIDSLRPNHRLVVIRRFGLYGSPVSTQEEIAHQLNLSRARVTLIEKEAVDKLRQVMQRAGLGEAPNSIY